MIKPGKSPTEAAGSIAMEEQPEAPKPKHVLVVDDNVDLAQTYQALFEAHDYRVTLADNGIVALKLLEQTEVDAILCDISMPQLEGDMFYLTVGRVWPKLLPRFVFVTGNADNPKYAKFLANVSAKVLCKPVKIDELLQAIQAVCAQPAGT
jgi:CheY-like chemotaxis protein